MKAGIIMIGKYHRLFEREREDGQFWPSFTDLLTTILLVFILIFIAMMIIKSLQVEELKETLDQIMGVRAELIKELKLEFEDSAAGVSIDEETWAIIFSTEILFDYSQADLKSASFVFLDDFVPKYLDVLLGGEFELDVNPDNVNRFHIEAYEEGIYYGKCAELCGPSHSLMDFKVIAVSPEKFEQWKDDMQNFDEEDLELDAVAQEGKDLYEQNSCMNCHAIGDDGPDIGPNLTDFGNRVNFAGVLEPTKDELVRWIIDPDEIKEDNRMKTGGYPEFNEDEAEKIAEFLMQLKATSVTPDDVDN